jgi:hypothetical protein
MTYLATRAAFLLTAVFVLFFAHWLESGRAIAVLVACAAIVIALARYGNQAVTLALAERHRTQTRES